MQSLGACVAPAPTHALIVQTAAKGCAEARRGASSTRCAAARSQWRGTWRRRSPVLPGPPPVEPGQNDGAAPVSSSYSLALAQSILRLQLTAEQLAAAAAREPTSRATAATLPSRLQAVQTHNLGSPLPPHPVASHGKVLYHEDTLMRLGALSSIDSSMLSSVSESNDEGSLPPASAHLQRWQTEAAAGETLGFNSQQRLTVPGLADIAVLSWGGRARNKWKAANQDAFAAAALHSTPGHPAALLVVCDGHGRGGEHASAAAACGLANTVPQAWSVLQQPGGILGSSSHVGGNGGDGGSLPVAQEALIAAFQAVGTSMQAGFWNCGAAAVACLLQPHCLTAVWTGDCRAVAGLVVGTTQGPAVLVHQLTRDHKPENPLEHARIVATARGRVVQLRAGQSHRLCSYDAASQSIALSRALGDAWATELGLTFEPDALSITLPTPASISADWGASSSSDDSSSRGSSATNKQAARPARHVLVVGSDGLWDMLTNEEAVGIALSCASPDQAAEALMHTACRRWAAAYEGEFLDDITLAVAFLPT